MNKETDEIDTSEKPKCPECGYITFVGQDLDEDERYCMECGEAYNVEECDI